MEDLHGDFLLTAIEHFEGKVLEVNVVLDVPAGKLDLLVLAFTVVARIRPVAEDYRECEKDDQDPVGRRSSVSNEGDPFFKEIWHAKDESGERKVAEVAIALCKAFEGSVLDCRTVCDLHRRRHGCCRGRCCEKVKKRMGVASDSVLREVFLPTRLIWSLKVGGSRERN